MKGWISVPVMSNGSPSTMLVRAAAVDTITGRGASDRTWVTAHGFPFSTSLSPDEVADLIAEAEASPEIELYVSTPDEEEP